MKIEKLTQHIGAELIGVNLAEAARNDDLFGAIKAALLDNNVRVTTGYWNRVRSIWMDDCLFPHCGDVEVNVVITVGGPRVPQAPLARPEMYVVHSNVPRTYM